MLICSMRKFDLIFVSMTLYIDFQIKQLNVPIKVKIYEWNAGGLLSRIEVQIYSTILLNSLL